MDGFGTDGKETCRYKIDMSCLQNYPRLQFIGAGISGKVFASENFIVKLMPLYDSVDKRFCDTTSHANYEVEVKNSKLVSKLNLGPQFVEAFICKGHAIQKDKTQPIQIGVIAQVKWDMNLLSYATKFPDVFKQDEPEIRAKIFSLIKKYVKARITHTDLHLANIVVNVSKQNHIYDLTFIDFESLVVDDADPKHERESWMVSTIKDELEHVFDFGNDSDSDSDS